jgi:hypothetical protein
MRHPGPAIQTAISLAMWLLLIILSPVILVAGEPVNRYVMRRVRSSAALARMAAVRHDDRPPQAAAVRLPLHTSLLLTATRDPLWIAITAPGRWVSDRFRRPPSRPSGR